MMVLRTSSLFCSSAASDSGRSATTSEVSKTHINAYTKFIKENYPASSQKSVNFMTHKSKLQAKISQLPLMPQEDNLFVQ